MARLFTSGFEKNTITNGVEWTTSVGGPTISSTTKRTGSYSMRINGMSSGVRMGHRFQFASANGNGPYFFRFYIYVVTLPSAGNRILEILDTAPSTIVRMTLNANGTLQLGDEDGDIGSPSAVVATNTWTRIEVKVDRTAAAGSHVVEAKLNGIVFATSSTRSLSAGVALFRIGGNLAAEAQTQGEWFLDDCAINDTTGSVQTSYPGEGKIIMQVPNAAGDANAWLNTSGGAGADTNYQLVDEIPPNDVTDFVQSNTENDIDMYNFGASGIGAGDIVTLVTVDSRFRNGTVDAVTSFRVRLEKAASGTVVESASMIPNSTTWVTNAIAATAAKVPALTAYVDPDGSSWTKTTLDSLQAGVKLIAAGTTAIQVSSLVVMVEYVEGGNSIFTDE